MVQFPDCGDMHSRSTSAIFAIFDANTVGRDFAVGDIHGCFSALQAGLDSIGFDHRVDRLFSVGDLVDRGPESHQVLTWLDKPWFYAIAGNHDFMTWRSVRGQPYNAVDHVSHGGAWLGALKSSDQKEIGERLAALPLVAEIAAPGGAVGLVHADCPFDDWADMRAAPWAQLHEESPIVDCCLWSFERYKRQYADRIRNIRAVVHGHMTMPTMKILGNVYFIDTGGGQLGRHFTFLDLHKLKPLLGPAGYLSHCVCAQR